MSSRTEYSLSTTESTFASGRQERGTPLLDPQRERAESARQLTVMVVDTEVGFDALRDEWKVLVSRLELPSPFQSWEWHRAWWRYFSNPSVDRLRLILFRRAGDLVGIAPLKERRRLGFTELSPLCWRDRITEYGVLLFPVSDRALLLDELWGWLQTHRWTSVGFAQLGEQTELPGDAAAHVVSSEPIVFEHLQLPKTWEALGRRLNQSMRSNTRYYPRLMAREGHPYLFEVARSPEQVAGALPTLWALHSARAAARTKIRHRDYMNPTRRAFLLEVLPLLAKSGEAAIGLLKVDGDIVAAQLVLEQDRTIFMYYSGFQPAWARYSVAMITTSEVIKDAISRGVERVEFLRGANHFKSRWGTETRTETEFVLARRRRLVGARESYLRYNKNARRKIDRWRVKLEGVRLRGSR